MKEFQRIVCFSKIKQKPPIENVKKCNKKEIKKPILLSAFSSPSYDLIDKIIPIKFICFKLHCRSNQRSCALLPSHFSKSLSAVSKLHWNIM